MTSNNSLFKRSLRKFHRFFPKGFEDLGYDDCERRYKWEAHQQWNELLNRNEFQVLLKEKKYDEIAARAIKIESKTNLLFSFEKMAIRDAVKSPEGARLFTESLFEFLYGKGSALAKFEKWCAAIAQLPRRQTRVLTWPIITVFGFIAQPKKYMYFKPTVTRVAAANCGFDLSYSAPPSLSTYRNLLKFVEFLKVNLHKYKPKDLIDIQSFIWVMGSSEFDE